MADPQGVAFAPTSPWNGTAPTWFRLDSGTAVTWNITGWSIERGRSSELDKTETGHATITIADTDGSFDPTNSSSPFFGGGLDPMRQVAITVQNPVTDQWRHLFKGFVSEWNVDMHTGANIGFVTLEASDGFDMIAAAEMYPGTAVHFGTTPPEGSEGDIYFPDTGATTQVRARINQILDDVRWPAPWRHIFSGNNQVQETVYARRSQALEALYDAADAEFPGVANVYMSRRGNVIFHGRYVRFDPESYATTDDDIRAGASGEGGMPVFWNAGGVVEARAGTAVARISGLSFRRSKNDIINAAFAAPKIEGASYREGDAEVLTQLDQSSIDTYGWRGVAFENLLIKFGNTPPGYTAVEEAELIGQYYVDNKADPQTRVTRLEFTAVGFGLSYSAATWALICGVEIGDVITLNTTHWGGDGGFSEEDFFVEGIRYEWEPGGAGDFELSNLRLSLDVSPRAYYVTNPWGTTPDGDVPEE